MKDTSPPLLFKSIRRVRAGEFWVGREMVAKLVAALVLGGRESAPPPRDGVPFSLTPREREIVAAVASGYTNRQMANRLGIAEDTIKHHLTNVFDKTGASNRLELALFAIHYGLHRPGT
jgi:DNA-binding NarL/FixJ family response regulator